MILSHLFIRHKTPAPRFVPTVFIALIMLFTLLGQWYPVVALVGLGTTLIVAASLVEANRQRIWDEYNKLYRKQKGLKGRFTKPNHIYYTINVLFLWPFIIFLGLLCLTAAMLMSS